MILTTIEQHEYDFLLDIQKNHPELTFQNNGYEYINKSKLTEEDLKSFKEVEDLLRKSIHGFSKFFNFRLSHKGIVEIRFDYHWSESFTGVGYLELQELLNGFNEKES